jgi:hypothetical protein
MKLNGQIDAHPSGKNSQYPLYVRLGGLQSLSEHGWEDKNLPYQASNPDLPAKEVGRYADWAITTTLWGIYIYICIVGGWSPNWVHSARRPFTGLLYLPRVIERMENLVEWMAGETEVLGENLPRRHFVHHKSQLSRPPRWEASD